ncbi:DUF3306 domain-containing protein [Variovorax sp. RO1]|uniref:DUF3306 domain-containing protein n=1 Tax=Variovorax sp. RO1 TaxID=2066034 RepID=UPI000C717DBE|nr:DUF3306 domain-containing protein [Variovorax sp. RO1]PLC03274.1 DUF3306 domain-containing protein [Variovorax sp. RO1]
MSEGFLGRWSRRKQEVRAAETVVEEKEKAPTADEPVPAPGLVAAPVALPPEADPDGAPPLTLADVDALGIESDYTPFLTKQVAPEVKNAAFRKLFTDPHFNVMDGLDTYVDDYSQSTPVPESVLRQMASAKFLKLFDEEPKDAEAAEDIPPETPDAAEATDVAQSQDPATLPSPPVAPMQPASQETDDHHADLRLQPDDAARAEDARRGTG